MFVVRALSRSKPNEFCKYSCLNQSVSIQLVASVEVDPDGVIAVFPDGLELPAELPYKKVGLLRRWVPLLFDDFASTETLFQPRLMGDTIFDRPAEFSLAV